MPIPPVPNSSTGGYMVPDAAAPPPFPPPLDDDALDDLFHDLIAGVLHFDVDAAHEALVRPRFQVEPANAPPGSTSWIAFSFQTGRRDWDRVEQHHPDYYAPGVGATVTMQDQELELFLSFYGPQAGALQGLFEDGVKLMQNREAIDALGIKFMGAAGDAFRVPALFKEQFRNRWDQKFRFRRRVYRVFPILNIASAEVAISNEHYATDVVIDLPPLP
jgi:hypothetical protein